MRIDECIQKAKADKMQQTSAAEKKTLENLKAELQEGSQEIVAHQKQIKVTNIIHATEKLTDLFIIDKLMF